MKPHKTINILDCTLRDGGYYNNWDFEPEIVQDYLLAIANLQIDFVEIGFRTLKNNKFNGGFAYCSDIFLNNINIPSGLKDKIAVMINGSEIADPETQNENLIKLFKPKKESSVNLVRIACHVHEFISCLPASSWLKGQGYLVGFNLMQVANLKLTEITKLAQVASEYPIDVLYFADTMGSLNPQQVKDIVYAFKLGWKGVLGIHTHDNMGQAIANSLSALDSGVTWIDATVTGMGRGPGNAQTEYLILALSKYRKSQGDPTKLFELIRKHFKPLQNFYGWGTNPFYYLAGLNGIHPTYIQEMLKDKRYNEVEIIAVINYLKNNGGKKFNKETLEYSRQFYSGKPRGSWQPNCLLKNKTILILGSGPSIKKHQAELESFIRQSQPYVMALNTQSEICQDLIDVRAACHPIRLIADYNEHQKLQQPLILPLSNLPKYVKTKYKNKELFDFGISVTNNEFKFHDKYCELPTLLVISYALAIASSGQANQILLAGFDGYSSEDTRMKEMNLILKVYQASVNSLPLISITPTRYEIPVKSVYGLNQ